LSRLWIHRAPGSGIGGFTSRLAGPEAAFAPLPGLLPGAAGIGLALLALASGEESPWDRILLLSSRTDGTAARTAPAEPAA
jgi:hypothetical protein